MSIDDPNGSQGQNPALPNELTDRVSADASEVMDQAKHDLDAITQRAKEDVRNLGDQASEKLSEATGHVKSFAGDQKDMAASQISGVAAAIGKVADELEGSDQATVARYARDLASGLSGVGKTIEERDVDDLMGLAQDFGRKQPVAFLGAAALAGFVASRFALASAHRRDNKPSGTTTNTQQADSSSYGQGYTAGQRVGGQ